jgi:hypothetical protein
VAFAKGPPSASFYVDGTLYRTVDTPTDLSNYQARGDYNHLASSLDHAGWPITWGRWLKPSSGCRWDPLPLVHGGDRGHRGPVVVGEVGDENGALARASARLFADFLMQHVDLRCVSLWPPGRVQAAFRRWRAEADQGNV